MNLFLQRRLQAMQNAQGADGGDGGSGASGADSNQDLTQTEEFKRAVEQQVELQTKGLKENRDSIRKQLNSVKERLNQFGDVDPETIQNLLTRFESEEEKELLQRGDVDAIVNRRVDKMKQKYEQTVTQKEQEAQQYRDRAKALENRAIAAAITQAALEAGGAKTAIPDFVKRAYGNFQLTDKGDVVAVDSEGNQLYDVDGKTPLTAQAWAASLQAEAPHLFVKAGSAGAQGGQGFHTSGKINGTQTERQAYLASKYKLPLN